MTDAHTPLAIVNRTINPLVRALLQSPIHRLVSEQLLLLTVTGRRSHRTFTFPVGYRQEGDVLKVNVASPQRKRWWRNLRGGAEVTVLLRGVRRTGTGHAHGGEHEGVTVEIQLDAVVSGSS